MVDNYPVSGRDYRRYPVERRGSPRYITVLQTARIITERDEEICILKNISETGLRADTYSPVSVGDGVSFELRTLHHVAGRVVWTDGRSIGVSFDEKVAPQGLLGNRTLDEAGFRARAPRLQADVAATVRIDGVAFEARVRNVSLAGARIAIERVLHPGEACEVAIGSLKERKAYVRWWKAGEAGIMFAQPIPYPEFSEWRKGRS